MTFCDRHVCRLIASITVCFTVLAAAGEEVPPPLTMTLRIEKKDYVTCEPIYVKVEFRNNSDQTLRFPEPRFTKAMQMELIRDGQETVPVKILERESSAPASCTVKSKESIHFIVELLGAGGRLRNGQYRLTARYTPRQTTLRRLRSEGPTIPADPLSAETTFVVHNSPVGHLNKKVLSWINRPVLRGPVKLEDYELAAPMILLYYNDTTYARYARYWMGRMFEDRVGWSRAATLYREQLRLFPDIPNRDDIEYRAIRAESRARLDDKDQTIAKLKGLLAKTHDIDMRRLTANWLRFLGETVEEVE